MAFAGATAGPDIRLQWPSDMTERKNGTVDRCAEMPSPRSWHGAPAHAVLTRAAILFIVVVTMLTFAPALQNEFVSWDDDYALIDNDAYRGLSGTHLWWMFTTGFTGHYQPLSWLSFAIDAHIWGGVYPAGSHLTNLLLHVLTCVGFFLVVRRLIVAAVPASDRLGRRPTMRGFPALVGAVTATLLFAVHPLRVESVAWATERRDVLSGAWLMLTILFYLRSVGTEERLPPRRRGFLVASLVCYVFSLLSKASAVSLPVVLLLLDVYPLRRFLGSRHPFPDPPSEEVSGSASQSATSAKSIIMEKLLFVVPAVLVALVAVWAQAQSGALRSVAEHPITLRIGQACYGIVFYVCKTACPTGLIPLYEQDPHAQAFALGNVLSAGVVILISIVAWVRRGRWPALLIAWGIYLAFLGPTLGLAQSGPQIVADRYSYLSCMAWAVLIGGGVTWVWASAGKRQTWRRAGVSLISVVIIGVLAVLTAAQTRIWADSETLWRAVLARAPDTGTAHANLAVVLNDKEDYRHARDHSRAALAILPGNRVAHIQLGRSSAELGDLDAADEHLRIALRIRPNDPGTMLQLASVATRRGRHDRAETQYRKLVDLEPDVASWHTCLAGFLAARQRYDDARAVFEDALRLDPSADDARFRLGVVLLKLGEPAAAIATFEEGLRHAPQSALLSTKLAWVLATCVDDALRDGPRALQLARSAVAAVHSTESASPGDGAAREALAAALAETGEFPEAVDTLNKLLADEHDDPATAAHQRLNLQLEAYKQGRPIRD